mmetsp:Transcript_88397/g.230381  ORF Transcript_88397/g.230381 Transcript_88397/m.230381 type:complete len:386 (+) Transcript_88397:174-1331(+)
MDPVTTPVSYVSHVVTGGGGATKIVMDAHRVQRIRGRPGLAGLLLGVARLRQVQPRGEVQPLGEDDSPVDLAEKLRVLAPVEVHHQHIWPPLQVGALVATGLLALLALEVGDVLSPCVLVQQPLQGGRADAGPGAAAAGGPAAPGLELRLRFLPASLELLLRHAHRHVEAHAVLHAAHVRLVGARGARRRLPRDLAEHVADEAVGLQLLLLWVSQPRAVRAGAVARRQAALHPLVYEQHHGLVGICLAAQGELVAGLGDEPAEDLGRIHTAGFPSSRLVHKPVQSCELGEPHVLRVQARGGHMVPQQGCVEKALIHGIEVAIVPAVGEAHAGHRGQLGPAPPLAVVLQPAPEALAAERGAGRRGYADRPVHPPVPPLALQAAIVH